MRMKQSIRVRLVIMIASLMLFTILTCWLMNKTLLPAYYQYSKIVTLGNAYDLINQVYTSDSQDGQNSEKSGKDRSDSGSINDSYTVEQNTILVEEMAAKNNLGIYVVNIMRSGMMNEILYQFIYPENPDSTQKSQVEDRIKEYALDDDGTLFGKKKVLLAMTPDYYIYKVYDQRLDSTYIELFGIIDNGYYTYIRANYESMQASINISNKFLGYIGLVLAILGMVITYVVSLYFTKPILKLSEIAGKMSRLDFSERYKVDSADEIGVLGNTINLLSDQLEQTISELKTANNELKQDIAKKEEVDEMRKEFLSNVSHELKTPIALIQGYAEGLKENINDNPEDREFYCSVIIDEANKMNHMVKKLLTLNQLEFGNDVVTFEHFDLTALIQAVLNSTNILFEQNEITVVFDAAEPIYVWADEYKIEEVLTNYISNAVNHIAGRREIRVSTELRENVVRVSVFNSGEPIPDEELDKIWIKFYKVDKARTREYGGSGIGLSIVKATMKSMNQQCGVCNHEDGVEFWFEVDRNSYNIGSL